MLEVLYQDEYLVAINKPHGLLVHRSPIARNTDEFAIQQLRDQLDTHVYPAHRLDRKTSGVLLFGLNKEVLTQLQKQFQTRDVEKVYWAIVRGFTTDAETIDYPLKNDSDKIQEAITDYKTLCKSEMEIPFGKHQTSRYSLVEAKPQTGRMHQLRKHFAHINHPIIGDRPHGCNKQNKLFLEKWDMKTMLLHAKSLVFNHPISDEKIQVEAPLSSEFGRMLAELSLLTDPEVASSAL